MTSEGNNGARRCAREREGSASARVPTGEHAALSPDLASLTRTEAEPGPITFDGVVPIAIGRYEVLAEIGRGGMGVVYRARDPELGREVSLKVLLSGRHATPGQRQRFLREARAVAKLDHDAIIKVHDMGEHDGKVFFTMDLVAGGSLHDLIEDRGRLPGRDALALISPVARGMHHAHERGLVHRDVKPANVLLTGDGKPMLTDFGLVLELERDETRLTRTGQMLGTPAYMAPEQARGDTAAIGPRSDVYSLGAVLYELVTGRRPFEGQSSTQVMLRVLSERPRPPRALARDLPRAVERICQKAMAAEPADRYPSAAALADDIERYLRGDPIVASGPSLARRARRFVRRNRTGMLASALAVAVIAGGLAGWSAWSERRDAAVQRRREAQATERLRAVETRIEALLSEDRTAAADEAFRAFAAVDENHGTRALARGWLHHAERVRDHGDDGAATTAYANAYIAASHDVERDQALIGLARLFHHQGAWAELSEALAALDRQAPELAATAEVRRLRIQAAAAERDLDRARRELALAPRAVATGKPRGFGSATHTVQKRAATNALLAALATATETEHTAAQATAADVDVDGRSELFLLPGTGDSARLVRTDQRALPVLTDITFPDSLGPLRNIHGLSRGDHATGKPGTASAPNAPAPAAPPAPPASPGAVASFLGWHEGARSAVLWGVEGGRLIALHQFPEDPVFGAASGDLDGDGRREIYVGVSAYARHLLALERAPNGTWSKRSPHPATNDANSDIDAVLAGDLDGDGRDELVVAAGAWNAYDVRVLAPDGTGRELTLRARRKLGVVAGLVTLPRPSGRGRWIAAIKLDVYPSRQAFAPDRPFGEPAGVYVLSWERDELELVHYLPLPIRGAIPRQLVAGDFNGDGLVDLAVGLTLVGERLRAFTVFYVQLPDGSFGEVTLRGIIPLAAIAVDDDPADELVVTRRDDDSERIWVLGAGERAMPLAVAPSYRRVAAPAEADAVYRRIWERAEDVLAIGLAPEAAGQLRELASFAASPALAARATLRAAELLEAIDRFLDAAALYEDAAGHDAFEAQGLAGAARCYERVFRFADALRTVRRLRALPGADRVHPDGGGHGGESWADVEARLAGLVDPSREVELVFDGGLDDAWRIDLPLALRSDPRARGLRLHTITNTDRQVIARRRFEWNGGPLALEVELDVELLEWGSGISVALRSEGGDYLVGVGAQGRGGGSLLNHLLGCLQGAYVESYPLTAKAPATDLRAVLRIDISPDQREFLCTTRLAGREQVMQFRQNLVGTLTPGPQQLLIAAPFDRIAEPMLASALVRRIHLIGVRPLPDDAPESPRQRAHRLLASGDTAGALTVLDDIRGGADATEVELLRYVILDELARWDESEAALASALTGVSAGRRRFADLDQLGPLGQLVTALLRTGPERAGPALRRAGASDEQYFTAVWSAWSGVIGHHATDPALVPVLTAELIGLERAAPPSRPERVFIHMALLEARAAAWRAEHRAAPARVDLERALALGRALLSSPATLSHADVAHRTAQKMAGLHRALAGTLMKLGDDAGALAQIRHAFTYTTTPELLADRIAVQPDLAALHGHDEWHALVTATQRSGR